MVKDMSLLFVRLGLCGFCLLPSCVSQTFTWSRDCVNDKAKCFSVEIRASCNGSSEPGVGSGPWG